MSKIFLLFAIITLSLFSHFYTNKSNKLTAEAYYNYACPKHFDVACDNINLK
jgi:hypothetical protein